MLGMRVEEEEEEEAVVDAGVLEEEERVGTEGEGVTVEKGEMREAVVETGGVGRGEEEGEEEGRVFAALIAVGEGGAGFGARVTTTTGFTGGKGAEEA